MYDERNRKRSDFGLSGVFGIRKSEEVIGTNGNAYCARIERPHDVLRGFENTDWIAGAEYRVPIAAVDGPILTVVPGSVAYPPELSYPSPSHTNGPALVMRQKGRSRLIYIPGDVERTLWRSGHGDLSLLLRNCVRWVAGDEQPVRIDGPGLIEAFAWETDPGFAVHVLNYTNPAAHKGWIRSFPPIGSQTVALKVPDRRRVVRGELLRSETALPIQVSDNTVTFTIPRVVDYEIAALYAV